MKHVKDPAVNYYPIYSIEYVRRDKSDVPPGHPQAWAQFASTTNIWAARLLAVENWLRHSKNHKTRVRVF